MQQNYARLDKALLASTGAGFPMFTMFVKDISLEIFNPRNLRMVSVKYTAHFSVLNRKHILHDFQGVQTCTLKLLLLLIDPGGFFPKATIAINEVINLTSVGPVNLERSV